MLPFGVTIPATVPQGSEITEGLMNNPVVLVGSSMKEGLRTSCLPVEAISEFMKRKKKS
jgi:hypothetical protein